MKMVTTNQQTLSYQKGDCPGWAPPHQMDVEMWDLARGIGSSLVGECLLPMHRAWVPSPALQANKQKMHQAEFLLNLNKWTHDDEQHVPRNGTRPLEALASMLYLQGNESCLKTRGLTREEQASDETRALAKTSDFTIWDHKQKTKLSYA